MLGREIYPAELSQSELNQITSIMSQLINLFQSQVPDYISVSISVKIKKQKSKMGFPK